MLTKPCLPFVRKLSGVSTSTCCASRFAEHVVVLVPEEGDSDSDGSDIEVGGVTQNFTCSLSLKPYVDPMTSFVNFSPFHYAPPLLISTSLMHQRKICGHSFSREHLEDYFKQQSRRGGQLAKCPASGCNKNLSLADFAINKDLAKRTNAAERRRRRRALDDQGDEDSMDVI